MPIVSKRVQKLFPDNDLYPEEPNILLTTIKFPKNLLYLTDRLPKPRYVSVDEAGGSRNERANKFNITDGEEYPAENQLPIIPHKENIKGPKNLVVHILEQALLN